MEINSKGIGPSEEKDIMLDWTKFIDMSTFISNSEFNESSCELNMATTALLV